MDRLIVTNMEKVTSALEMHQQNDIVYDLIKDLGLTSAEGSPFKGMTDDQLKDMLFQEVITELRQGVQLIGDI